MEGRVDELKDGETFIGSFEMWVRLIHLHCSFPSTQDF